MINSEQLMGSESCELYLKIAKRHGEDSEPDHEVGDIQILFRIAWGFMTPVQRVAFSRNDTVRETVAAALGCDTGDKGFYGALVSVDEVDTGKPSG